MQASLGKAEYFIVELTAECLTHDMTLANSKKECLFEEIEGRFDLSKVTVMPGKLVLQHLS